MMTFIPRPSKPLRVLLVSLFVTTLFVFPTDELCGCVEQPHEDTRDFIEEQHEDTNEHILEAFETHELWVVNEFFDEFIFPSIQRMTESLTAGALNQVGSIGALFDAKQQLEAQLSLQKFAANAHRNYHPSEGVCKFGTLSRSLGTTDRVSGTSKVVLSKRQMDRYMGNKNTVGSLGAKDDRTSRTRRVLSIYCDNQDNDGDLAGACTNDGESKRTNNDISYGRILGNKKTLDINLTEGAASEDLEDIMALSSHIYAPRVLERASEPLFNNAANHGVILEIRALMAKRSAIDNSFHTNVALKTRGTTEITAATAPYIYKLVEELGISEDAAKKLFGDNPSYYAQMEVLAKKIYQSPSFYTDLYDKPTNVLRKDVSMKAIDLMLERDLYKSELRNETILSILLEMELQKYQDAVRNKLSFTGASDRRR